ncbi:MAG TPA: hypothetical protein VJT73_16745 [Polyangiaceae bacterium]|nr:hypothetical protein [Polyangiaceae bacterium]
MGVDRNLRSATWEELEAIEDGDRVLFPDVIRQRTAKGELNETEVMVRVLRMPERRKARLDARELAKKVGVDPAVDPELFDDIDTLCTLARAIRDKGDPKTQHMTAEMLEGAYEWRSLKEVYGRYKVYEDRTDPGLEIADEKEMWAALGAIARAGNCLPLVELASLSQNACIVFSARQALLSPTFKSFLESIDSSTAAS